MRPGDYSKSFITAIPADLTTERAKHFKKTIPRFPDEAVYIYSFMENRMIYTDGWEEILGYKNEEINMLTIVSITTPEYAPFSYELNDKALMFIQSKTERLEEYSFTIELKKLHKNGTAIPLISKVGVESSVQKMEELQLLLAAPRLIIVLNWERLCGMLLTGLINQNLRKS
jgi:hypothetical protein